MTAKEKIALSNVIGVLCMNSGRDFEQGIVELWAKLLLPEMTIEEIETAAGRHAKNSKFFPAVSEILDAHRGNLDGRAQGAFAIALATLSRVGRYQSVQFMDPAIQVAIEQFGGWAEFARAFDEPKGFDFRKKDFLQIYKNAVTCCERPKDKHLAGLIETHNRGHGFPDVHELFLVASDGSAKSLTAADHRQLSEG